MKVGDKVVRNPQTWNPSEFDKWISPTDVGTIVELMDDGIHADIRWPAGKEWRALEQLLPVNKTLPSPPSREDLYGKHESKYAKDDRTSIQLFAWEVGDGWLQLIDEFLSNVTTSNPQIVQIKEKFGGLRIYGSFNAEDEALLEVYEEKAYHTCDACSSPGRLISTNGWLSVRCDTHTPPNSTVVKFITE